MALETVNDLPEKFDLSPGSPRVRLSIDATYQIEAMIDALVTAARRADVDSLPYLVQGVGARIYQLNAVIMSALCEKGPTVSDLRFRMHGQRVD